MTQAVSIGNVTRVLLGEDVNELVLYQATSAEAFSILTAALDIQEAEGREMTLGEALQFITAESNKIEALYRLYGSLPNEA